MLKIDWDCLGQYLTEEEIKGLSTYGVEKFAFLCEVQPKVLDILLERGLLLWYLKLVSKYYIGLMKPMYERVVEGNDHHNQVLEASHWANIDALMLEELTEKLREVLKQ